MQFGPVVPSTGPLDARIFVLGEAPGERESELLRPLVGPSGHELRRMMQTVGLNLDDCYKANVFSRQPRGNNLHLYGATEPSRAYTSLGPLAAQPSTFMDVAHEGELHRLYAEITQVSPNIILALGNTATWALGLGTGISSLRGSVHLSSVPALPAQVKVLPTYHPAMILRQWDQRVIGLADLDKARIESAYPELRFDNTELWLNPTLDDLEEFDLRHMQPAKRCACDIETRKGQIDFICFTPEPANVSLSIPFWVKRGPHAPHYWPTVHAERTAWRYVHKWMERPDLVKVFQNGLFDLTYIPATGCTPVNCSEDTMLASHSLYSEMQKGLGFLGSIHANVPSWKSMYRYTKEEALKRDD